MKYSPVKRVESATTKKILSRFGSVTALDRSMVTTTINVTIISDKLNPFWFFK